MPTDSDFQQVTADSLQRIDDIFTIATDFKTLALAKVDALNTTANAHIALLDSETFEPTFDILSYSGLNLTYAGAPSDVSLPDLSNTDQSDITLADQRDLDDFSFSNSPYAGLVKNETQSKLISVLGGTIIIPEAVKDAIFQRSLAKLAAAQARREWDASNFGAAKRWQLPSVATLARLDRAEEETDRQQIELTVTETINEWSERHKDTWNAIQQGIPFEQAWMSDHHQAEDRELRAAEATVRNAIAINTQLIQHDDLRLRQYGIKWERTLQRIGEETRRYQALISEEQLGIQSEQARLGYETLNVRKVIDEYRAVGERGLSIEQGVTSLAINKAELAKVLVESLTQIANLMAAMTQGALAASDVSVGTGTNYSYAESVTI